MDGLWTVLLVLLLGSALFALPAAWRRVRSARQDDSTAGDLAVVPEPARTVPGSSRAPDERRLILTALVGLLVLAVLTVLLLAALSWGSVPGAAVAVLVFLAVLGLGAGHAWRRTTAPGAGH